MTGQILLVDDDKSLSELLTEFLLGDGFEVDAVYNGKQAIEQILQRRQSSREYDVIVLDIMMPEMSGLEVLKALRVKTQIPIIMLTGRGGDIDRILGLEMGADDYMGKPATLANYQLESELYLEGLWHFNK